MAIDIAPLLTDGYKLLHHEMYPENLITVMSNLTPRSFKHALPGVRKALYVGGSATIRYIHKVFKKKFFRKDKEKALMLIKTEFSLYTGLDFNVDHFAALHDLGYLPIVVRSLDEGTFVPEKVPVMVIYNTKPDFAWLVNYLETLLSNLMWLSTNSATIAAHIKKLLLEHALRTDKDNIGSVEYQAHDFSMRGMGGIDATLLSGLGHAFVFLGSDNIPVIRFIRKNYSDTQFIDPSKAKPIFHGVPATEHSVMCAGDKDAEISTFSRLLYKYPKGILSIVSDTWDLWKVLTVYMPALKEQILARDGKLVVRPDSGNPVDIICGLKGTDLSKYHIKVKDFDQFQNNPEYKGVIELLWDEFGGTINEQGYKVLNKAVGAIYGDSINYERAREICERLEAKGFASTNIVLGIGSYTYQYNTRDTLGFAVKATYVEIANLVYPGSVDLSNEKEKQELIDRLFKQLNTSTRKWTHVKNSQDNKYYRVSIVDYFNKIVEFKDPSEIVDILQRMNIFKDPITDEGTKKSAKGITVVKRHKGAHGYSDPYLEDESTWAEFNSEENLLKLIYANGSFYNEPKFFEIRDNINKVILEKAKRSLTLEAIAELR